MGAALLKLRTALFCKGVCSLLPDLHCSCSESHAKMMQTTCRNCTNKQDSQRPPFVLSEFPECVCVCDLCFSGLSSKLTVFSYKPLALAPGLQSQMGRPTSPFLCRSISPATPRPAPVTAHAGVRQTLITDNREVTERTFKQVSKYHWNQTGCLSLCVCTVHICRIFFIRSNTETPQHLQMNECLPQKLISCVIHTF